MRKHFSLDSGKLQNPFLILQLQKARDALYGVSNHSAPGIKIMITIKNSQLEQLGQILLCNAIKENPCLRQLTTRRLSNDQSAAPDSSGYREPEYQWQ